MPVTVAPVSARERKISNGTSGFFVRRSVMTKAVSSAALRASSAASTPSTSA